MFNPDRCDPDIFQNGTAITVLINSKTCINNIMLEAAKEGLIMDWHYVGGRGVVKTLGDVDKCRKFIADYLGVTLEELY
jgi:hypothetical protein